MQASDYQNLILLALGIVFIISLLWYGQINYKVILFLVFVSPFIRDLFNTNEPVWVNEELETGLGGYSRGFAILLGGFSGILIIIRSLILSRRGSFPLPLLLLLFFILSSVISTFYSVEPSVTLSRSILFLMLFLFLTGLYYRIENYYDINEILNLVFYIVTLILILCFLSLIIPSRSWYWKSPSRFIGLFSNPNGMGSFLMLSYPVLLWKFFNSEKSKNFRTIIGLIILISIIMHLMTGSRTSMIAAIIGISLWFYFIGKKTKLLIGLTTFLILVSLVFLIYVPPNISRGDDAITTVTGRDVLWKAAVYMITKEPITGYGYLVEAKVWADPRLFILEEDWITPTAQQPLHNGYISIALGNGIPLFFLWLILICLPIFWMIKIKDYKLRYIKSIILTVVIMILITNFFESFLTGYLTFGDLFFWIMWILSIRVYYLFTSQDLTPLKYD